MIVRSRGDNSEKVVLEAPMRKKFWILASFLALSVLAAVTAAALCEAPKPEASAAPEAQPGGYVLTDAGRRALVKEYQRLKRQVEDGQDILEGGTAP